MKTERGGFHPLQREQLLQELVHDSYKLRRKLVAPAHCPECDAIYQDGHWRWGARAADSHAERCPACHRIHDHFPAGYVNLQGEFFRLHREEILGRVRNCEVAERQDRPLERLMRIEESDQGVMVTTTGTHLARRIGDALYDAYKGTLDYRYNKEENLLRVNWSR